MISEKHLATLRRWNNIFLKDPHHPGLFSDYTRALFRQRVTPAGRMLLLVFFITGLAALTTNFRFPFAYLASFLFTFMLIARLAQYLFHPPLHIERTLPERCAAGTLLSLRARVTNRGRLPVFDLAVTEQIGPLGAREEGTFIYIDGILPGETVEIPYRIATTKRGVYDWKGPVALSAFPFGLYHEGREVSAPHRMLVHPPLASVGRVLLPLRRRHLPGGMLLVHHVGDSEEFLGNREYRIGDRLRDLDHRAWARLGVPIIREYREEYFVRIALLLDTWVLRGDRRGEEEMEAALSLAAGIADTLGRQEHVIDLFAAGPEVYHLQIGRGLAYLDQILDALACLEPCRDNPFSLLLPKLEKDLREIGAALVLLLDWDETRAEVVRFLEDRGVAVKILLVRNRPLSRPLAGTTYPRFLRILSPHEITQGLPEV